jgi:hypothetical protein
MILLQRKNSPILVYDTSTRKIMLVHAENDEVAYKRCCVICLNDDAPSD